MNPMRLPSCRRPWLEMNLFLSVLMFSWLPVMASALDGEIVIHGSVRGLQGEPLVGATIRLLPVRNHYWDWFEASPAVAREVGRSQADGSFAIKAPAQGLWTLSVEQEGLAPMRFELRALLGDLSLPEVVLQPAKTIRLRAVGPRGEPIGDAWVLPPRPLFGEGSPYSWQLKLVTARTGADGVAEVRIPRDDLSHSPWWIEHPLYLPREIDWANEGSTATLLPVTPSDSEGRWLVVKNAAGSSSEGLLIIPSERRAPISQVEEDDHAWLPGISRSSPPMHILAPEEGRLGLVDLEFQEGAQEVRTAVPMAREISGYILDETTRQAIPGAFVWLARDRGIWSRTDARGAWRLSIGKDEKLIFGVDAQGYLPLNVPVVGRPGDRPSIELSRSASLEIAVRGTDGSPVLGVEAELRHLSQVQARTGDRLPSVRTWVDPVGGRAVARKLVPSEPYEIVVGAPGFAPVTRPWSPPASGGTTSLDLILEPANRLRGRVTSASGEPLGQVEVVLVAASGFALRRQVAVGARLRAPALATASTAADGTFEIGDLPRGPVDLIARRKGFSPTSRSGIRFPQKGRQTDLGTLTLGPTLHLQGRVVDSEGQGVEGAEIFLTHRAEIPGAGGKEFSSGGGHPLTTTDVEGAFTLRDIQPDRPINLQIHRAGFVPKKLEGVLASQESSLVVTLSSGGSIEGAVLDSEGRPLPGAFVAVELKDGLSAGLSASLYLDGLATTTDAAGKFRLQGIPPGDLDLQVRANGYRPETQKVDQLGAGQVRELTFRLEEGVLLEGLVVTHKGDPAGGSTVRAGGHQTRADEAGKFSLGGLAPGQTRVAVRHPTLGRSQEVVGISPTGGYVEISLPASGQIVSTTVDEGGSPVEGATVRLLAGGSPLMRRTDRQGAASFERVPSSADALLLVEMEGYVETQKRVTVSPQGSTEVTLVLQSSCTLQGRILSSQEENLESLEVFASRAHTATVVGTVDYRGEYGITGLKDGSWTVVARSLQGRRGESKVQCSPADRVPRVDLELDEGFSVLAMVSLDGQPIAGSEVQILDGVGAIVDGGRTDRHGTFAASGLKEGRYRIRAVSRERRLEASEDLRVPEMDRVEIPLVQLTLAGNVVDSSSGLPVTGARLRLLAQGEGALRLVATVSSDSQGQFRFPNVEATHLRLAIDREGFANQVVSIPLASLMARPAISIPLRPAL
ncbi:MAG: carboxypeptidase-like regulatory domain-containing protein [Deltaproteobacteria bacterium]|nr:carboxypeptidase-like regulatory domain-containing protein [Deltaproteobacteria bacterium]